MKLLIIGASHGIGLALTKQALEQGHEVSAMSRSARSIGITHARLEKIGADITDPDAVTAAVSGKDAVCLTIGTIPTFKTVHLFSEGTRNVLEAMERTGVERLVAVTGIGAGESRGHGGFFYDTIAQPLLLRTIYDDKERQEALIRGSSAVWTIVRPGFLTNGPLTGKYRVLTEMTGVKAGKISRADVAHFMLSELAEPAYVHQAPLICYQAGR
jgi:putative NADH-flavin reductase